MSGTWRKGRDYFFYLKPGQWFLKSIGKLQFDHTHISPPPPPPPTPPPFMDEVSCEKSQLMKWVGYVSGGQFFLKPWICTPSFSNITNWFSHTFIKTLRHSCERLLNEKKKREISKENLDKQSLKFWKVFHEKSDSISQRKLVQFTFLFKLQFLIFLQSISE